MSESILLEARKILLNQYHGFLSTNSYDCAGYPFGSVVPVCKNYWNQPIILISRLAQHTINIQNDARVSLLLTDAGQVEYADVQSCQRITLIGNAQLLADKESKNRYYRFYPQAQAYHEQMDFDFYLVAPVKVRFIGGFGKIHWFDPEVLCAESPFDVQTEAEILEHMNRDHCDALVKFCRQRGLKLTKQQQPVLVGVDGFGFDLRSGHKLLRFEFASPVVTSNEMRQAFIALLSTRQ